MGHNSASLLAPITSSMSSLAILRDIFPSWTDDDLLYVLVVHANGEFERAVNTILHHETTGQPPQELIRLLGGGSRGRELNSIAANGQRQRRRSYSDDLPQLRSVQRVRPGVHSGSAILNLNRSRSEMLVIPAETETRGQVIYRPFHAEHQQVLNSEPENAHGHGGFEISSISIPSAYAPSSTVFAVNSNRTDAGNRDKHLSRKKFLRSSYEETENKNDGEDSSRYQHLLNIQSGIEASLKETENISEETNDEEEALLSYALKVSSLHSSKSSSVPVQNKSEEELIHDALRKSLTDSLPPKSEEELIQEALDNSIRDLERNKAIMKVEDELLEEVIQNSLLTKTKDEELIEAALSQSLLPTLVKKSACVADTSNIASFNYRKSSSTTYPLEMEYLGSDDEEEEGGVEYLPPPRFDSPLTCDVHLSFADRKMPALEDSLPTAAAARVRGSEAVVRTLKDDDDRLSDNLERRFSRGSDRENNGDIEVEFPLPLSSRFEQPPLNNAGVNVGASNLDLDRKIPATITIPPTLPMNQKCFSNSSSLMNDSDLIGPHVASRRHSSATSRDLEYANINRSSTKSAPAFVAQKQELGSDSNSSVNRTRPKSLLVEGASLSLINGVYHQEVNKSKVFNLRLSLNGDIIANIRQTTLTDGRKEWVFSIARTAFSFGSGADIILYTASVDQVNEDWPSNLTNWVGRHAIVLGGPAPRVSEFFERALLD